MTAINDLSNPQITSSNYLLPSAITPANTIGNVLFVSNGAGGLTNGSLYYQSQGGVPQELSGTSTIDPRFSIQNVARVKKNPGTGEYLTIAAALAGISAPTTTNRWVIYIGPGTYLEAVMTIPAFVYLVGVSKDAVIIQNTANTSPFITLAADTGLYSLTVTTPTSTPAISVQVNGSANITDVNITAPNVGLSIPRTSAGTSDVIINALAISGATGTALTSVVTTGAVNIIASSLRIATSAAGVSLNGNVQCSVYSAKLVGTGAGTAVSVQGGAIVDIGDGRIDNWATGINNPAGGAGSTIFVSNIFTNCTTNINVQNTLTTGYGDGFSDYPKTLIADTSTFFITEKAKQVITVAARGGDYTTIAAAIASIGTITPAASSTQPYVIKVAPGNYTVTATIILPSFVEISGEGYPLVNIIGSGGGASPLISAGVNSTISEVTLTNPGGTLISYTGSATAGLLRLSSIRFGASSLFMQLTTASGANTTLLLNSFAVAAITPINGFDVSGAFLVANNLMMQVVGVSLDKLFNVYGTGQALIGNSVFQILGGTGGTFAQCDNGTLRTTNLALENFTNGIVIPASMSATTFRIVNLTCIGCTNNVTIANVNSSGSVFLIGEKSKVSVNAAISNVSIFIQDPTANDSSITMHGRLFYGRTYPEITDMTSSLLDTSVLGLVSGGVLTNPSGRDISATAGYGYILQTGHIRYLSWNAQGPITVAANLTSYLFINSSGVLQSSGSKPAADTNILLGAATAAASSIVILQKTPTNGVHMATRIDESFRDGLGVVYRSGSIVTQASATQINVTTGQFYYGANGLFSPAAQTPMAFDRIYSVGATSNITLDAAASTTIPETYNTIGAGPFIVAIPAGQFTAHAIYASTDNVTTKYIMRYGQSVFASQAGADGYLVSSGLDPGTPIIATIVVQQGAGIVRVVDRRPYVSTVGASSTTTVTSHSALADLGSDDHLQYLPRSGVRAMTGTLDLGTNAITGAGLINGVNITTHAARHQPGGADAIPTAAPVTIGTANAIGASTSLARADHVHAHGAQTDGTLHAVATTSVSGFMSAADKTTFDNRSATTANSNIMARDGTGGTQVSKLTLTNLPTTNTMALFTNSMLNSEMNLPWNVSGSNVDQTMVLSTVNGTGTIGDPYIQTVNWGILSVPGGGTGRSSLTASRFVAGNGTSAVDLTKVVPTGAVVGTTDTQSLTNKTLSTGTVINGDVNITPLQSVDSRYILGGGIRFMSSLANEGVSDFVISTIGSGIISGGCTIGRSTNTNGLTLAGNTLAAGVPATTSLNIYNTIQQSIAFSGFSAAQSFTLTFTRIGRIVTITFPDCRATTPGGSIITLTIPSALNRFWPLLTYNGIHVTNNGGNSAGLIGINGTTGVIEIYPTVTGGNFAAGAANGLFPTSITFNASLT